MIKKLFILLFIALTFFFLICSCGKDEKELNLSSDLLFSVQSNTPVIELENKSLEEEIKKSLNNLIYFNQDMEVVDMILKNHIFDSYLSEDAFDDGEIKNKGTYSFSSESTMTVNFSKDNESVEHTFSISGPLGKIFYNHFVGGGGNVHNVQPDGLFCLTEDYTEYFQNLYPEAGISSAKIKSDMKLCRGLITFK